MKPMEFEKFLLAKVIDEFVISYLKKCLLRKKKILKASMFPLKLIAVTQNKFEIGNSFIISIFF